MAQVFAVWHMRRIKHIDFSGSHSEALAKVNKHLQTLTSPDQILPVRPIAHQRQR